MTLIFKAISLKDLDVNAMGMIVTLKSYQADTVEKNGKITLTQKMSPLSIIPPKDSEDKDIREFTKALTTMNYDRLEFTMGAKSILDEKADNMRAYDTYVELRDGFRLSYDFDITGYKEFSKQAAAMQASGSSKNPLAAMGMANALQFNKLRIALRDDSIVDRYFKLAATEKDTTPDALKAEIKEQIGKASMVAQDEAQQKLADDFIKAVTAMIDEGGTFVIEMNPAKPVNFGNVAMGAMIGGEVDIEALGLSISTQ